VEDVEGDLLGAARQTDYGNKGIITLRKKDAGRRS